MQPQPSQPAQTPQQPVYDPATVAEMQRRSALVNTARQVKAGANYFYWIAALSVVNSLITIFGGGVRFVIGLGATLFIDLVAKQISDNQGGSPIILGMGFLFSLIFDLIFVACAYFAGKGKRWAFITGLVFYALDAVLMLFFQEWIGFAFHLYFMWGAWQGLQALGRLKLLEPAATASAVPPAETMR
jgi:hypothetical protein